MRLEQNIQQEFSIVSNGGIFSGDRQRRKRSAAGALLAGAAFAFPIAALAADDPVAEDDEQAGSILVQSSRSAPATPTTLSVDPAAGIAAVYSLDQDDISGLAITTANDLLRAIPGVQVADLGNGGIPNGVTIRGWSLVGDGVSVRGIVDGYTRNFVSGPNNNGSNDLNILIPEIVGSVDVIKGPFDTRYSGNFAYAGTAIFKTVDRIQNRASLSYGFYGRKRLVATIGNGDDPSLPTHFYFAFDGLSEQGRRDNNDQDKFNAFAKVTSRITPDDVLKVGFQLYSNHYGQPGYIRTDLVDSGQIDERSATDNNAKGWRRSGTLTAEWEHRTDSFNFDANFWVEREKDYRSINRQDIGVVDSFPQNIAQNSRWSTGLGFHPWAEFSFGGIEAILRGGAEIRGDFAKVNRGPGFDNELVAQPTILNAWTGFFSRADFTVWNPDVYAELSLKPAAWFKITGGLRNDWFNYDATVTYYPSSAQTGTPMALRTVKFNTWSNEPTLHGGIAVGPFLGFTLLGNFGEGITSQNINNAALWSNPQLDPTKLNTKEVVLKYDNDALGLNLQGGVYSTLNQGELGTDPLTGLQVNMGKSIRKGFDIDGRLRLYDRGGTSVRIGANYNYLYGKLTGGTNTGQLYITGTPPWTAGWNLEAATPVGTDGQRIRLSVQHNFVGGTYLSSGSVTLADGTLGVLKNKDYNRLGFRLTYERPEWRDLRVWFSGVAYGGDRFAEMATSAVGFFTNSYTVKGRTYRVANSQSPFRADVGVSVAF
ncbi:TonB-dependent receptor [Novosphingobium guangzhouense]|uniref:TonB-dependent receptor n=1 Tax=Novosphingobium guangzhouense TaxID=1850347 RepID=A0A2K2G3B7_9SPHN|nr:TonB-dependent receptor [Novosphingobium guangzhouense]PNU05533.1 hypothetical protein A8V01_16290 [Novosphingobium guangzhouense]